MAEIDAEMQRQEDIAQIREILELRAADVVTYAARGYAQRVRDAQGDNPDLKWSGKRLSHEMHGQVCLVISEEFPAMLDLLNKEKIQEVWDRYLAFKERLKAVLPQRGPKEIADTMEEDGINHVLTVVQSNLEFLLD